MGQIRAEFDARFFSRSHRAVSTLLLLACIQLPLPLQHTRYRYLTTRLFSFAFGKLNRLHTLRTDRSLAITSGPLAAGGRRSSNGLGCSERPCHAFATSTETNSIHGAFGKPWPGQFNNLACKTRSSIVKPMALRSSQIKTVTLPQPLPVIDNSPMATLRQIVQSADSTGGIPANLRLMAPRRPTRF